MCSQLLLRVPVLKEFKNQQGERKEQENGRNHGGRKVGRKETLIEHLLSARLHRIFTWLSFFLTIVLWKWVAFMSILRMKLRHRKINQAVNVSFEATLLGFELMSACFHHLLPGWMALGKLPDHVELLSPSLGIRNSLLHSQAACSGTGGNMPCKPDGAVTLSLVQPLLTGKRS